MNENLSYEYEKLYRSCQIESKANLFGRAYEIAMKKKFISYAGQMKEEEKIEILSESIPNMTDDFFLYAQDFFGRKFEQIFKEAVEAWMDDRTIEI